jgi:phosphatidate cytidylyltransferase
LLAQRVAAAVIGVPLIFLIILAGGGLYAGAVAAAVAVAAIEFEHPRHGWVSVQGVVVAAACAAIAGTAHAGADHVIWALGAGALGTLAVTVGTYRDGERALGDWTWTAGALLYAGLLGSFLVLVRDLPDGRDWAYLVVFSTFATDTAAYFVGRAIGRRKLAPAISPGKTVEGAFGALAGGFAAVLLLNYFLGLRVDGGKVAVLAVALPVAAVIGDLAESALKRGMRIKDASELIPGHGGVLDRLDSMLFTFAVTYLFVQWAL